MLYENIPIQKYSQESMHITCTHHTDIFNVKKSQEIIGFSRSNICYFRSEDVVFVSFNKLSTSLENLAKLLPGQSEPLKLSNFGGRNHWL